MSKGITHNTTGATLAFDRQSVVFDQLYSGNTIIRYKRERVRQHIMPNLSPGSIILELNSGTGEDAAWFAQQGHYVCATDAAPGMQEKLREKMVKLGLTDRVSTRLLSYTMLDQLEEKEKYDLVFSNFAGLNCTAELEKVLQSLFPLLKPGGQVTLVLLPEFCLWETLLLFKGKFRTAFRRFFSSAGRKAKVESIAFTCWYYAPSFVKKIMRKDYDWLSTEGLCTIVPPSYIEGFAEKHPRLYKYLVKMENRYKQHWPWRHCGDYYIISFRKKISD